MLVASFICLVLLTLIIVIGGLVSEFDGASVFVFILVIVPLIAVTKLLFNI